MEPSAIPVMRKPRMALPVTGSPLHDWSIMTATSAATTTAPAIVRVRSRPNTCRISVTLTNSSGGTSLPSDERSAVDAHGLARDIGGLLGDQVEAGGGDVGAGAHAADGHPAGHRLGRRHRPGRPLLFHHRRFHDRGGDVVD